MLGLKLMRIKNRLTQEQLAMKLGLSVKQIRNYEQGLREPKVTMLKEIAKFFNCTMEELL